jgi:MFS family permease
VALVMISYGTLSQRTTPGALMGRVVAATGVLISGAQTVSIALGAILVSIVDYRYVFAVMAVGMLLLGVYLARSRIPVGSPAGDEVTGVVEKATALEALSVPLPGVPETLAAEG